MINQKLSFASKSDFLHHSFESYMSDTNFSFVWKLINIIEFGFICILGFLIFRLYVRTSVLSAASQKGPVTALLTAATPTAVKAMTHDFDFITYENQAQKSPPLPNNVQWYHTTAFSFVLFLVMGVLLYLLYKCCMRKCYQSQTLFRPDLIHVSHPSCKLKLVFQTKFRRVSVFVAQYPYDAKDLTLESFTGTISIRPHFTLHTSALIISWHGTTLFLDSLYNPISLPGRENLPLS